MLIICFKAILILTSLLFTYCCTTSVIYPDSVCAAGDVQADYNQQRDPRTLMGTYTKINDIGSLNYDEDLVDISVPIYEHSYFGNYTGQSEQQQSYLFKVKSIGWTLSETEPIQSATITVFLTCFQDSLFQCVYNKWYWGYNKYEYPIPTFKVLGGECKPNICIKSLTIQLKANPQNPPAVGDYSQLDGEFTRSFDAETGRYQWINIRASNLRWYYTTNYDAQSNTYTYNWILSENTSDRVACAPGLVDSPLFCTIFVYAGSDPNTQQSYNPTLARDKLGIPPINGGNTIFKMGTCNDTASPTMEPTAEPSIAPTMNVSSDVCDYNGQILNIGDFVEELCEFGYYGDKNIGYCLSNKEIGNWVHGCYKVSFSDTFFDFDDQQWTVYSTEGVSGDATLAIDGSDELRFIPENNALVGIIKSREKIKWPLRVRGVVKKRTGECNNFAIALGPEWDTRRPYSSRLNWRCYLNETDNKIKQMSLYNATFRLYDSKCWRNGDIDDSMDVVYTILNNNLSRSSFVTSSQSDCATLSLFNPDILNQNPWQNAYLWLGSYGASEDYDLEGKVDANTIIGRFDSIEYTQFFTDFDGFMLDIWNKDDILNKVEISMMNRGEKISSNMEIYQFNIPFNIRLGIKKPTSNGVYGQFVSLGGLEYINKTTDGVVQIVWRDDIKVRLAYSSENIYQTGWLNGNDCEWTRVGTTFDVLIQIDTEKVMVSDELCGSILVAKHGLNANQTVLTLGFIDDNKYEINDSTQFTYIEVYQLPLSYAGNIANQQALSDVVNDIDDILKTTNKPTAFPTNKQTPVPTNKQTTVPTNKQPPVPTSSPITSIPTPIPIEKVANKGYIKKNHLVIFLCFFFFSLIF